MNDELAIRARGLSKHFGDLRAVDHLDTPNRHPLALRGLHHLWQQLLK